MNNQDSKNKWDDIKHQIKDKWDRLTDDDINHINGDREKLALKIQERYGKTYNEIDKELKFWQF
ncbi:hypothetical protein GOQ27_06320 [Clostridium sp. D2Q-11]|uniref:CsbD-like domain-containing protein n=1 Tax=Anaeromonas frigoriresistens TaxID=2683708 RepID=A0A942URX6_9FIRM|nr:hypothetical protein [Anaeromonas frigoriresistens]MBS4538068.1 hypothetical protein [Anaeromonas frigoriresistens]